MQITQETLDYIVKRAKEFGAKKVILFGSALNDPEHTRDIDIACDIEGLDLLLYAGKIEQELRIPVDVVPLYPSNSFVEHISRYGKVLYAN